MMLPEWLTTVAWIALSVGFACTLIIAADIFLRGYRLSTACSANAGAGLTTGTAGWVTVTLAPESTNSSAMWPATTKQHVHRISGHLRSLTGSCRDAHCGRRTAEPKTIRVSDSTVVGLEGLVEARLLVAFGVVVDRQPVRW